MRVGRIAEQLGAFGAQLKNLGDDRVVVVLVAVVAAIDEHAPRLFAQVATIGVSQKRIDRRTRVHDHPRARLFLRFGGSGGGIAQRLRQSGKFVFTLQNHELIRFFGEHVLAELREQTGELLIDLRKTLLCVGIQDARRRERSLCSRARSGAAVPAFNFAFAGEL